MNRVDPRPETPPDVAAFLTKARVSRERATKKLEDVLRRLVAGDPPLDGIRAMWVFGSYARGALDVGDVDLYALVDDDRSPQQFALDAYYARPRPFIEHEKALRVSGASMVSLQCQPVFDEPLEPASPQRLAELASTGLPLDAYASTETPVLHHVVTDEPLAGPFVLLWARGDRQEWALQRLHGIEPDSSASRHERTTTVPLLDDLTPKLGLVTAFHLAAQVRQATMTCRGFLLESAIAPARARGLLAERYRSVTRRGASARELAAAAALHRLDAEGIDLRTVDLVDAPVTTDPSGRAVLVDFNVFYVYLAASGHFPDGFRHWHVWPSGTRGPWLALETRTVDQSAAQSISHRLSGFGDRKGRTAALMSYLASADS